jgi:hypothetical protein
MVKLILKNQVFKFLLFFGILTLPIAANRHMVELGKVVEPIYQALIGNASDSSFAVTIFRTATKNADETISQIVYYAFTTVWIWVGIWLVKHGILWIQQNGLCVAILFSAAIFCYNKRTFITVEEKR